MSKYDSLIKKVELFHKLAQFGDRKSFLQRLAQQAEPLSPRIVEMANSVAATLSSLEGRYPNLKSVDKASLLDAAQGQSITHEQLMQSVEKAAGELSTALGPTDPRASQARELLNLISDKLEEQKSEEGPTYTATEQVISVPARDKSPTYRASEQVISVDPRVVAIQKALNALNITSDDGKPLDADGAYGKLTAQALNKFMKNYNVSTREAAVQVLSKGPDNIQQEVSQLLKTYETAPPPKA